MVILSPDEILDFNKLGFIVLRQYYSGSEILKILDEVNRLESLMPEKGGMMKYYDNPFGQDSNNQSMILIRIEKFIEISPYLESIVNNPSVHSLLKQLLGESAVLLKEKINFKPPGAPPDLLHQDSQAGWDDYGSEFVSVLIAVEDSNRSNACVEFDNSGYYINGLAGPLWEPLTSKDIPNAEMKPIETKAGDIILFNSYVPHGSEANTSDKRRCNIYLTYNKTSDGDHRLKYFSEKRKNYPPNNERDPNQEYSFKV
jgi:hypothetical protein